MWKALFIVAALSISASPVDAAQPDKGRRIEQPQPQPQPQRGDSTRREGLRRDVERISQEIYKRGSPPPRRR
ncbi:MAG TPA: hypothetical protein VNH16_12425 [Burkholderiales bacterium]|jgi:hypothetical protein|nr:hypothetical protein [Burkholderiales bacterium]